MTATATPDAPTEPAADEATPLWKRKIMWPVYGLLGLVIVGAAVGGNESDSPGQTTVTATEPATATGADASAESTSDTEADEEAAPVAIATRDNPLPLGESVEVTAEALGDADDSVWSLTVTGPARDVTSEARTEGLAADPLDGHIIVGTPFELTLIAAGKEPLAPLFNVDVEYFSPEMIGIAETMLACGFWNEAFDSNAEVFVGGTISGLLCAEVAASDLGGGLLITADEQGDRVFLSTE